MKSACRVFLPSYADADTYIQVQEGIFQYLFLFVILFLKETGELMKKMRNILLAAALLLSMPAGIVRTAAERDENKAFEEFMDSEFREMMESDYLTMHYTLKDFAKTGFDKPDLTVGDATWESYEEAYQEGVDTVAELKTFDYDALSEENRVNYDTYLFFLENMNALNAKPELDFIFAPNGVLDNLTVNFTEFAFYREEDINDYLEILSTIDEYLDECLEVTRRQAADGYFMCDAALKSTLESIDKFTSKTDDNELIIIFDKNIDAMEGISDEHRQEYKDRNRDIVLNAYIPACRKVGEELQKLQGSRKVGDSVYDLEGGKEYYESLLKFKTSTDLSPQEIFDLADAYLNQELQNYIVMMYTGSGDFEEARPEEDAESVLHFLQDHLEDFPAGPDVTFTASYLDPSVANPSTVAYYMNPPIDDVTENIIRINGDLVGDTNELYTTLAHEGFPGHCYQITWFLNQNPHPLRSQISNMGYTEGWAMYVQDWAWKNSGLSTESAELQRMDQNVNYMLNAVCDVAVNGLGYSQEKLAEYLTGLGLTADAAASLYEFVCQQPALITPYGIGLIQFLKLKDMAVSSLQDQFNLKEFNTVLLNHGDRPFALVEADVRAYIESKGGTPAGGSSMPVSPVNPIIDPQPPQNNTWIPLTIGGICLAVLIGCLLWRRRVRTRKVFENETE